jgi:hypothetical protein
MSTKEDFEWKQPPELPGLENSQETKPGGTSAHPLSRLLKRLQRQIYLKPSPG